MIIRNTKQRDAIHRAFEDAGRPLTPQEILDFGRVYVPKLGIRTVYRNIADMLVEGRLIGLDYPGQPVRYELPKGVHRPHLVCRGCHNVFTVPMETPELDIELPKGWKREGEEVVFYGKCPDCAKAEKGRAKERAAAVS
jgi:Fur family ferric uptake transcriptional regulator